MSAAVENVQTVHLARGEVRVERVELTRGHVFRVGTIFNAADVVAHDYYDAAGLELARAVAGEAREAIAAGRRPDLQEIARGLKARDRRYAAVRREAEGADVLSTPPDELPAS